MPLEFMHGTPGRLRTRKRRKICLKDNCTRKRSFGGQLGLPWANWFSLRQFRSHRLAVGTMGRKRRGCAATIERGQDPGATQNNKYTRKFYKNKQEAVTWRKEPNKEGWRHGFGKVRQQMGGKRVNSIRVRARTISRNACVCSTR
jgi:hypothetical protein